MISLMHSFEDNIRISQHSKAMFTSAKLCQRSKRTITIYEKYAAAISHLIIKTYLKYNRQLILLNTVPFSILDVSKWVLVQTVLSQIK